MMMAAIGGTSAFVGREAEKTQHYEIDLAQINEKVDKRRRRMMRETGEVEDV